LNRILTTTALVAALAMAGRQPRCRHPHALRCERRLSAAIASAATSAVVVRILFKSPSLREAALRAAPWNHPHSNVSIRPRPRSATARWRRGRRCRRKEGDAVVALRRLACDQPIGDIGGDLLGEPLVRRAEAAAARQLEADRIERARSADLRLIGLPDSKVTLPWAPAPPPLRPRAGLLMRSKLQSRLIGAPSAPLSSMTWPSPPRCLPRHPSPRELAAAEDDGSDRLGRLDRMVRTRSEGGDVEPSLPGRARCRRNER